MTNHTPGPWRVTDEINRFSGGEVIRPNRGDGVDSPVAVVCDFNRYDSDDERQANPRLIAAAPDLLEALRLVIDVPSDLSVRNWINVCDEHVRPSRRRKEATDGNQAARHAQWRH